jgi:hypothetical protein
MIFRNPGPGAAGTLTVEEAPVSVTVTYNGRGDTKTFNHCLGFLVPLRSLCALR